MSRIDMYFDATLLTCVATITGLGVPDTVLRTRVRHGLVPMCIACWHCVS